jgi:signal transduction histidine kinase
VIDSSPPFQDPLADAKRDKAKQRLYVLCQTIGWGGFLVMQLFFTHLIKNGRGESVPFSDDLKLVSVMIMGLLITHYARVYIERWGLKEMGWLRLVLRAVGTAFLMSMAWSIFSAGWYYGVLRDPWPIEFNPFTLMGISVINGAIIYSGWLSFYFIYHVFNRFNVSEIERLRLTTVVKDAELRALKSQINPHFIFNSLNSVRALIDEDPARARQAVTQLANMLRYSLQSGSKQTVSFEDELMVVNDYLALEQVRHEERLRLRLDVAPETLRRVVPPMLLQTLVENAVKYGIAPRIDGGEIAIIARLKDGSLNIEVRNPGNLMMINSLTTKASSGQQSTQVGLRNALDRLQLLFGDSATLELVQSSPDEVTAKVRVPQSVDLTVGASDRAKTSTKNFNSVSV